MEKKRKEMRRGSRNGVKGLRGEEKESGKEGAEAN